MKEHMLNMKSGNMEIRKIQSNFKTGEDRTVEGYAVVFESPSVDLGWTEWLDLRREKEVYC